MTRKEIVNFELYIMDLVIAEKCKTAEDFENLSLVLHDSVESAIQEMCMDMEIDDYDPSY